MALIFIACVMHCCTQVTSPDKVWDDHDQQALDMARKGCYSRDKQCLVKLRKVEESIYTAICGKENN